MWGTPAGGARATRWLAALRCGLFGWLLASAALAGAASSTPGAAVATAPTLVQQIAALEHRGSTDANDAAQALERLLPATAPFSAERLEALTLRGLLLASLSQPQAAAAIADSLDDWSRARNDPAAAAAAALVRARTVAEHGDMREADSLLADAIARLPAGTPPRIRLRFVLARGSVKLDIGELDEAVRLLHEALALADEVGEPWRRAQMQSTLAYAYYEAKQIERARMHNDEAMRIAEQAQDHTAIAGVYNTEAFLRGAAGDREGERRAMQAAIDHARRGGAKADEALYLANIADFHLKAGEYTTALALSQQALPLVRELKDIDGETVALANIGLALISMGQITRGKQYVDRSIEIDRQRGSTISVAASLEELGVYLEKAGDLAGAVDAYHRHRRLADQILQRDQQKAIVEMQERFDAERRLREIALVNRDNELMNEQLRRRTLRERLGWLVAATFALSFVVLLLLAQRVRRSNRALESSNSLLLTQTERDPLTGLANRRHFQAAMKQLAADGKLSGTVFLIDIDHFKRINDTHGHAAGDAVLTEMARRLRDTLREQDLIVRWGGEEFLVIVRTLAAPQVEALAQRMLAAMAELPVRHGGEAIAVTGSIGFATFPMQPALLPVSWERAINLVDTAMYLAKAHGRNRAYGVGLLQARDEAQLEAITRSLETAWRDGQVKLTLLQGPSPLSEAVA